jgi:hypothetical protein
MSHDYFLREEAQETLNTDHMLEMKNEVRKFTYKSGAVYTGNWWGGFRHGIGRMKWADGATYDGQWEHGKAHGLGRFKHSNGDIFLGEWNYDKANGIGRLRKVD